jgi:hypothetical protein
MAIISALAPSQLRETGQLWKKKQNLFPILNLFGTHCDFHWSCFGEFIEFAAICGLDPTVSL